MLLWLRNDALTVSMRCSWVYELSRIVTIVSIEIEIDVWYFMSISRRRRFLGRKDFVRWRAKRRIKKVDYV